MQDVEWEQTTNKNLYNMLKWQILSQAARLNQSQLKPIKVWTEQPI